MSFEAVPCMFRSTTNDGSSSSYVGLLIRPSASSSSISQQQATTTAINATVVSASTNAQKAVHVVPLPVSKTVHVAPQVAPKVVVQSGVQLRLQPSNYATTSQCIDTWPQSNQRTVINPSFEHSSISQTNAVTTHMAVSDPYDCNTVPCTSANTFFPPISSITSFSKKSDIDLLQEMPSNNLNNHMHSQKIEISTNELSEQLPSQYSSDLSLGKNFSNQMNPSIKPMVDSCRFQNNYNCSADCSVSPDSGIQSIDGSPGSRTLTPSMPSPAPPYIAVAMNEVSELEKSSSTNCNDFSDMPRLIPFHALEPLSPVSPETTNSKMVDSIQKATNVDSTKSKTGSDQDIPTVTITPAMNVSELVEQLISKMDPEQRKQFATVIQTKVGLDSQLLDNTERSVPEDNTDCNRAESEHRSNFKRSNCTLIRKRNRKCRNSDDCERNISRSKVRSKPYEIKEQKGNYIMEKKNSVKTYQYKPSRMDLHKVISCDEEDDHLMTEEEKCDGQNNTSILENDSVEMKSMDECIKKMELYDGIREEKEFMKSVEEEQCENSLQKEMIENVNKIKDNIEEIHNEDIEKSSSEFTKELTLNDELNKGKFDNMESIRKSNNTEKALRYLERACINEEQLKKIVYKHRLNTKYMLEKRMMGVLNDTEKQLQNLHLQLGKPVHWSLPWFSIDWKSVAKRLKDNEKNFLKLNCTKERRALVSKKKKKIVMKVKALEDSNLITSSSLITEVDRNTKYFRYKKSLKDENINDCSKITVLECDASVSNSHNDKCGQSSFFVDCSNNCPKNTHNGMKPTFCGDRIDSLEKFETSNGCGFGVKTLNAIDKGQFICEYIGEIIPMREFLKYRSFLHHRRMKNYAVKLSSEFVVDASSRGNISRFINHSCKPNCEIQRWSINGILRIGIFALRSIKKEEELSYRYSYDFEYFSKCLCNSSKCCGFIGDSASLTAKEIELIRKKKLLLLRNLRSCVGNHQTLPKLGLRSEMSQSEPTVLQKFTRCAFIIMKNFEIFPSKEIRMLKTSTDNQMKDSLLKYDEVITMMEEKIEELLKSRNIGKRKVCAFRKAFQDLKKKHSNLDRRSRIAKAPRMLIPFGRPRTKSSYQRILAATTDLTYIDSQVPVGSYDPDIIDYSICANEESDCVRCICGTPDDDGQMVQCGKCYFWLHGECIPNFNSDAEEYICEICSQRPLRTPTVEILLRTKLELELKRCIYYRTLVNNRNIQVRINEAVYVQRPVNDNHKTELRILEAAKNSYTDDIEYSCVHTSNQPPAFDSIFQKAAFNRKNLMCFRVERLLLTPSGSKLVFGFYYARPHEVYCEPSKMFHEKELFATTLFDTLPLDCVVGRCLILDSTMYCAGRPRVPRYHESDVFFCDTGYNTKISKFEKLLPKYHYTISTDPLIFERFPEKLQIARSFSPFIVENKKWETESLLFKIGKTCNNETIEVSESAENLNPCFGGDKHRKLESIVEIIKQNRQIKEFDGAFKFFF